MPSCLGTGFEKPQFPTNITYSITLADLVSWFIFNLYLDSDFLTEEVDE